MPWSCSATSEGKFTTISMSLETRHKAGWRAKSLRPSPRDTAPRFLLRDRDASYGQTFRDRVQAMAIEEVDPTAPRSPVAERLCRARPHRLDPPRMSRLTSSSSNERHLRRVLLALSVSPPKQDASLARQGFCQEPRPIQPPSCRHRCCLPTGRRSAPSLRASRGVNCRR